MNNIGLGGQLLENGENDNSDINWKIIRLDHYDLKLGQKLDDKLMDIIFQASEKGHFIRIQWPIGLDNEIFLELLSEIGCYSNDYQTKKGLYRLLPWLFDLPQEFTLLELHHPEYNQEKYAFAGNIKKGYQPLWWHDGGLNNNGSRRKLMEKVKNAVQDLEMLCEIIK